MEKALENANNLQSPSATLEEREYFEKATHPALRTPLLGKEGSLVFANIVHKRPKQAIELMETHHKAKLCATQRHPW